LDDDKYRLFAEAAEAQNRPIDNFVETAALAKLHEDQFVDDFEMSEILRDEELLARLKEGSADGGARRGRFVD
jgi:uncharacterized protein (DUF1778 family)